MFHYKPSKYEAVKVADLRQLVADPTLSLRNFAEFK